MLEFSTLDNLTINEILSWRACNQSQKLAYRFLKDGESNEVTLSYSQLEEKSQKIAQILKAKSENSLKQNSHKPLALLLYPPGLEFICAFFGCLHGGILAVPSSLPHGKRGKSRIDNIIKTAGIDYVLTDSFTYQSLKKSDVDWGLAEWVITDELVFNPFFHSSDIINNYKKEDIAFIQYTSGSTNFPKGAMISHQNLIYNLAMIKEAFGHNEQTIFVGWLPFFHDMGLIGNILQPLYLGIETTLMSPLSFLQKPIRWLNAIDRYRATTSGAPNFAYDLCTEKALITENLDLSCWKIAFSGSESIQPGTLSRFYKSFSSFGFSLNSFYSCYGLAEATLFVSGNEPQAAPIIKNIDKDLLENEGKIKKASLETKKISSYVSVGRSWKDQKIVVIDPEIKSRLPSNVQGEICIQGLNVAQGYWRDDKNTNETFHVNIDNELGYFLRTGDLGFFDEDGQLYITSRLKDLIIIRGRNIIPQDIEISILESHPAFNFNGCAAFSINHEEGEVLIIVTEIKREYLKSFVANELITIIKRILSIDHGVDALEIVLVKTNTIPKTSSGKIQRNYCKKLFINNQLEVIASNKLYTPLNMTEELHDRAND